MSGLNHHQEVLIYLLIISKYNNIFELIIVIGGWKYKPELVNNSINSVSSEITNTHLLVTYYIQIIFTYFSYLE